jgi:MscS family membrane protein
MHAFMKGIIKIIFFLSITLGSLSPGLVWAQTHPKQTSVKEAALPQTIQQDGATQETVAKQPDGTAETPALKPKGLDKAGENLGKRIDSISRRASSKIGPWIEAEVFAGITWLKLFFCLFLIFMVVVSERLLRWLNNTAIRKIPLEPETLSVQKHFFEALSRPLSLFIWSYGIYGALSPLYSHFQTPDGSNLIHTIAQKAADVGAITALFWFILRMVQILDVYLKKWATTTENSIDDMLVPIVAKTLRLFIVIIGGIIVLQNLTGLQIGPLVASLGIGGLAVALAAKDSIANFFGTLTILFDKPFQVGQRITIDEHDGIVEDVGFRSTRIRTLTGHLLTIPNEKVVNSTLENVGQRPFIRWLTNIGVTYDTPPDKVEKAVIIIREILENHEGMNNDFPPRVFFNGFNDWSLNITVIVWYHPPDYWDYQAWLQNTCLEIMRRFEAEGIDFAFPSRTIYVANDDKRQLKLLMLKGENKGSTSCPDL